MRPVKILTMLLAGGIGERLYPLTAKRSKPAVPFGGSFRIIDFTLMNCVLSGLRSIHVLSQYHSHSLDRHKNERWNFLSSELGEFIEIVPPRMRTSTGYYQGTADAVYRNLDIIDCCRPDVVLVLSGDHVYRADYGRLIESHLSRDADVTVLAGNISSAEASSFGILVMDEGGRIADFVEKPKDPSPYAVDGACRINLGVYCFQTRFLVEELVNDSKRRTPHDFGKNILPGSLARGDVLACPIEAVSPDPRPYWRDVGTIDSYFRASMDLLDSPPAFDLRDRRWPAGSRFFDWLPSRFPGTAGGRNLVSHGCDVGLAHVERCVLSPGARIGERSRVEECILLPDSRIGRGVRLKRVIIEEGVEIPDGLEITAGRHSEQLVRSPGGIVVVPAGYRFEDPQSSRKGSRRGAPTGRSRSLTSRFLLSQ